VRGPLSRRDLLQLLGLAAAGSALPRPALADAPPPRRVLFFVTSHGTIHDRWAIRGGRPRDVDYSFDLDRLAEHEMSTILAPLHRHRDQLIVLDGLGNAVGVVAGFLSHAAGSASSQSGWIPTSPPGELSRCSGASLDQVLGATRDTPFRSLEWATGGMPVCFDALGAPLPYELSPAEAWRRLFPLAADDPVGAAVHAGERSVLDLVAGRFDAVLPQLPSADRDKLALHKDLVRDLENRVGALEALDCAAPDAPDPTLGDNPASADYTASIIEAFTDMAVVAFSCGLTDVITVRVDDVSTASVGAPPGNLHSDIAHAVASNPGAVDYMTLHHTHHAREVAALLDRLAAIPEGDGTLLDHTLVVWHNELSTGDHLFHTVPVVLAGLGTALQTGRYHRYSELHSVVGRLGEQKVGRPHNRMLTTIGQALGLAADHTGHTEVERADGSLLDLTGVLPGVLR
jgi:hypothetical protein